MQFEREAVGFRSSSYVLSLKLDGRSRGACFAIL